MVDVDLSQFSSVKIERIKLANPNSKKLKEYEAAMRRGLAKLKKAEEKKKAKAAK